MCLKSQPVVGNSLGMQNDVFLDLMKQVSFSIMRIEILEAATCGSMVLMAKTCGKKTAQEMRDLPVADCWC